MRRIVNISNLSFPDFDVEKMEFSPQEKILKVFVEGAWLEENGGKMLDRGVYFLIIGNIYQLIDLIPIQTRGL